MRAFVGEGLQWIVFSPDASVQPNAFPGQMARRVQLGGEAGDPEATEERLA